MNKERLGRIEWWAFVVSLPLCSFPLGVFMHWTRARAHTDGQAQGRRKRKLAMPAWPAFNAPCSVFTEFPVGRVHLFGLCSTDRFCRVLAHRREDVGRGGFCCTGNIGGATIGSERASAFFFSCCGCCSFSFFFCRRTLGESSDGTERLRTFGSFIERGSA